jgi:dTDP-4-amino-4,6-dideoxygalactose transaminase
LAKEETTYRIPFNRPTIVGKELFYISQAIHNGYSAGDAGFTKKCHALLESILNVPKVLLTTSCTHALELSARLLDIQHGDEVIVPSFTFVSTVNAFVLCGAYIRFIDIRPDTLNLDENQLPDLITPRTKAIVPVHYAGVGCEMDPILKTAKNHGIAVVEDNAHGLFGKYKGRFLGTFGTFGTQSFHETKNFICGEGGALIINDPKYVERAEIIREKGTNRSQFFRGEVDKYTWVDIGSSYLPSDLLAAFLYAQLEEREQVLSQRKAVWDRYALHLRDWANNNGVKLPYIPSHCEQPYHMFYIILPKLESRTRLIEHLKSRSILSVFHYVPLHSSPMGKRFGNKKGKLPVTESISNRLLRLPFYNEMTYEDQTQVIEAIRMFSV